MSQSIHYRFLAADYRYCLSLGLSHADITSGSAFMLNETNPNSLVRTPIEAIQQLYALALAHSDDSYVFLRMGQAHALADTAEFEGLLSKAKDGWQLMDHLVRYFALFNSAMRLQLVRKSQGCELQLIAQSADVNEHFIDCAASSLLTLCTLALGCDGGLAEAYIGLKRDDKAAAKMPDTISVRFKQAENLVFLPNDYLYQQNPHYKQQDMDALTQFADAQLQRLKAKEFVGRVQAFVELRLAQGVPLQEEVARDFNMSVRNLQRRLQACDTSYREVVDHVRCQLAKRLIGTRVRNMGDVANALGFEETNSFFKAFKRWTGITPGDYRKSLVS